MMLEEVTPLTAEKLYADARAAYVAGDLSAALERLTPLVQTGGEERHLMLLGEVLTRLDPIAAAEAFEQAAAQNGRFAAQCQRRAGELFFQAGDDGRAQLLGLRALSAEPDDPATAYLLCRLFLKSGETQLVDALKNRLVASDKVEHLRLASDLIGQDLRNPATLTLYRKLHALFPSDWYTTFSYHQAAMEFGALSEIEVLEAEIRAALAEDPSILQAEVPHSHLMWERDEQRLILSANVAGLVPYTAESRRRRRSHPHRYGKKLRIGYLSADFWAGHSTMRLLRGVLESHNRDCFEIVLFDYTPEHQVGFDDGSRAQWGDIVRIGHLTDAQAVDSIRARGIDVLVDLKGFTAFARPNILNLGAAPVQVAWLGFPGSAVGIDCDYVIGDPVVTPPASQPHFHEVFCRLPECYQPNDLLHRPLPERRPKALFGLPEDRVVIADFNMVRKIRPETLDLWLDVLVAAPETVLWLMADHDIFQREVIRRAVAKGIEPSRVYFARKIAWREHVDRLACADLLLDTFPCNGHTTTSDALWAGVPVMTMRGTSFAGRVSESLLTVAGLAEDLVCHDRTDFIARIAVLADDRARLAALRRKTEASREGSPLHDHQRFCRHLELAFGMMVDLAREGQDPRPLDVPALPR